MSKGKRLAAGSMGYGRTFYPDEPEDLAYLKQLAKETRGDENRWPELNLRIYRRPVLRDGEPCAHPGCLSHVTHPCEGCGRVGGRSVAKEMTVDETAAIWEKAIPEIEKIMGGKIESVTIYRDKGADK
jgi:hypothetical protein